MGTSTSAAISPAPIARLQSRAPAAAGLRSWRSGTSAVGTRVSRMARAMAATRAAGSSTAAAGATRPWLGSAAEKLITTKASTRASRAPPGPSTCLQISGTRRRWRRRGASPAPDNPHARERTAASSATRASGVVHAEPPMSGAQRTPHTSLPASGPGAATASPPATMAAASRSIPGRSVDRPGAARVAGGCPGARRVASARAPAGSTGTVPAAGRASRKPVPRRAARGRLSQKISLHVEMVRMAAP